MLKSLLTEYGVPWVFNRSLYSAKLKMMKKIPGTEKIFEKKVKVKKTCNISLNVNEIEVFLKKLSKKKQEEIIITANNSIQGKIKGFSSMELNYGNPIKWSLNPITNKEVDTGLKWFEIPDFDSERGDIKAIWEISRFTHFFYFVRAYMLTKEKKYYDAFSNQLNDWLEANPYSYGPNYKCGQEATLRMINGLIAYSVFNFYKLTREKDDENIRQLVEDSYKKVLSNFFYAHKCIKNNHTLSEITGLIIGSWACEDQKRLNQAYTLLDKEIKKQFRSDGGYKQYSFNYQRFALQLMGFLMKISEKTKIEISKSSKRLIKKSAYLIYQLQDENGDIPNYGSNDGALIFPVTSCGYRDFRPIVNTIFSLIDGRRVYEKGDYDEELIWFGKKSLKEVPIIKIKRESVAFRKSGFYSLRHDTGFLMVVLQDFKSRPAQMDQLHIDLWHRGVNVFCDSGSYSYASEFGKKMSLTSAHNTVKVENKEQMKKYGPFLIYDWTKRENVSHNDRSFTGTMISKNGYVHTRSIEKKQGGYSIVDEVKGDGDFCEFYFHTPCDVKQNSKGFSLYYGSELICDLTVNGNYEIKETYRSLYYLKKEKINCIVIRQPIIEKKCSIISNIFLKSN